MQISRQNWPARNSGTTDCRCFKHRISSRIDKEPRFVSCACAPWHQPACQRRVQCVLMRMSRLRTPRTFPDFKIVPAEILQDGNKVIVRSTIGVATVKARPAWPRPLNFSSQARLRGANCLPVQKTNFRTVSAVHTYPSSFTAAKGGRRSRRQYQGVGERSPQNQQNASTEIATNRHVNNNKKRKSQDKPKAQQNSFIGEIATPHKDQGQIAKCNTNNPHQARPAS